MTILVDGSEIPFPTTVWNKNPENHGTTYQPQPGELDPGYLVVINSMTTNQPQVVLTVFAVLNASLA